MDHSAVRNSCLRGEGVDARILVDRERIVQGEAGPVESFGTRTDGSVPGTLSARVRFILRTSIALGAANEDGTSIFRLLFAQNLYVVCVPTCVDPIGVE